jgi:hypothetical protein
VLAAKRIINIAKGAAEAPHRQGLGAPLTIQRLVEQTHPRAIALFFIKLEEL